MFDTETTPAPPTIDVARDHVGRLLAAYQEATGFPKTFCAKVARGEPKFAKIYMSVDFGFGSYDAVNSRLSAVWPAGAPWPAGIPRQAPADMPEQILAEIARRSLDAPRDPGTAETQHQTE